MYSFFKQLILPKTKSATIKPITSKKEVPLYILKILEETIKPYLEKYDCSYTYAIVGKGKNQKPVLSFEIRHKKPYDHFFFRAEENGNDWFSISKSPYSERDLRGDGGSNHGFNLSKELSQWEDLVIKYSNFQSTFFEDPIIQNYEDEFFAQWKILEDDADTKPFDLQRQILIDKYLDDAVNKLETLKTKANEKEIEDLKSEATEIRESLTRRTKNQVVRGLARFWAKARKAGLPILREILIELASGVVQKMLMG